MQGGKLMAEAMATVASIRTRVGQIDKACDEFADNIIVSIDQIRKAAAQLRESAESLDRAILLAKME